MRALSLSPTPTAYRSGNAVWPARKKITNPTSSIKMLDQDACDRKNLRQQSSTPQGYQGPPAPTADQRSHATLADLATATVTASIATRPTIHPSAINRSKSGVAKARAVIRALPRGVVNR